MSKPETWIAREFASPRDSYYACVESDGRLIVGAGKRISKAHAHLIAAAPELLQTLKDIVMLPQVEGTHAANRAKEVIAKAEGESR